MLLIWRFKWYALPSSSSVCISLENWCTRQNQAKVLITQSSSLGHLFTDLRTVRPVFSNEVVGWLERIFIRVRRRTTAILVKIGECVVVVVVCAAWRGGALFSLAPPPPPDYPPKAMCVSLSLGYRYTTSALFFFFLFGAGCGAVTTTTLPLLYVCVCVYRQSVQCSAASHFLLLPPGLYKHNDGVPLFFPSFLFISNLNLTRM